MPHDDLAAILLVGGRSSRMGRPKPWLDFGGMPLLARVVETVRPWVDEIVVVAAPAQELPRLGDEAAAHVRVLRDTHPGEGPLPAVALGLAAVRAPWALVLGCDAPLVRAEVVALLAAARTSECDGVVPMWNDRPQPLVALYRARLAPALAALVATGERRLHVVAGRRGVERVAAERLRSVDPDGESFWSMNTPAELAVVLERWRTRRADAEGEARRRR